MSTMRLRGRIAAVGCMAAIAAAAAPVIEHTPVAVGVRGEGLMIRAKVDGRGRAVKSVAVHYSTSRDAAPFSVAMQSSGAGAWVGTIPGGVLAALEKITYYISAEDDRGATAETPWFVVRLQAPTAAGAPSSRPGWVKPVLIGGGAALVAGGIGWALSSNSGGDGGGGGGQLPKDAPGTYSGSATRCQTLPGSPPACETTSATIRIGEDGSVSSSDLYPGATMQSAMSGVNFVLSATVRVPGRDGEIRYIGTLVGNRIVGSIEGSAGTGTNTVLFSGTFTATKR